MPRFTFPWQQEVCKKCGKPLLTLATRRRQVVSLTYGRFLAIDVEGFCPRHRKLPPARSPELPRIVAPGCKLAYDLIAKVGMERFVECRQCEEIQLGLSRQYGIELPVKTISYLSQKFVAYFQVVHQESIGLLRGDMCKRGGYILHIDGTCEEASHVLLICFDSLSEQVLESCKISSENTGEVRKVLQGVRRDWGVPLAIVHDLRKSLIAAAAEVFHGVPQFVCHYHLAADVGKDLLSPHVDRLRCLFRRTKVRSKLGALCRSLKEFAVSPASGEHVLTCVMGLNSCQKLREYSTPEIAKGAVHSLASWILASSRSGEGYGFPFDLPYLKLHQRILTTHQVLVEAITDWSMKNRGALGSLKRFKQILDTVVEGEYAEEFHGIVTETKRLKIFLLRTALRICPKDGKKRRNDEGAPSTLSPNRHKALLQTLQESLARQSRRDPASDKACNVVTKHLKKYWDLLFGHVIKRKSQTIVVPRTNNIEERLFRTIKRQCRRPHGRGHLSRDLDAMSAGTALVLNLRNTSYCETVYGGAEPGRIAARFSTVDPKIPVKLMEDWRRERLSKRIPRKFERIDDLPQKLSRYLSMISRELNQGG